MILSVCRCHTHVRMYSCMHAHTRTHTHIYNNTFFLLYGFGLNTGGEIEQWSTKAQEGCIYVCGRFIDNPQLGTGYIVHKKSHQHCDSMLYILLNRDMLLL